MIKLSYVQPEDESCYTAIRSVDMSVDCEQELDDIIEAFNDFLKACGYCFAGEIKRLSKEEIKARDDIALDDMMDTFFSSLEEEDKVKQKEHAKGCMGL